LIPANTRIVTYEQEPGSPDPTLTVASKELALAIAPNPANGNASITLTLPVAGPARVELFDLSGRVVSRKEVGGEAGIHSFRLGEVGSLRPGIYLVRLTQGGIAKSRRVAIIR
jgi:type IX secretion system substrate protein